MTEFGTKRKPRVILGGNRASSVLSHLCRHLQRLGVQYPHSCGSNSRTAEIQAIRDATQPRLLAWEEVIQKQVHASLHGATKARAHLTQTMQAMYIEKRAITRHRIIAQRRRRRRKLKFLQLRQRRHVTCAYQDVARQGR